MENFRALSKISALSLFLFSPTANAIPQNSVQVEFAQKIAAARNWLQFNKATTKATPLNIRSEIEAISHFQSFPSLIRKGSEIRIQDENGTRVRVRLESNGKVFLNDSEWSINPLVSVETEMERISKFISANKLTNIRLLEFLIPSAFAGINGSGVAQAAYGTASGWTNEQCGNVHLSNAQQKTCPLTAAPMAISYSPPSTNDMKFFPITLSCPKESDTGVVELISKNKLGSVRRLRVTYLDSNPYMVEVSLSLRSGAFKKIVSVQLATEKDPGQRGLAESFLPTSNSLKSAVCEGSSSNRQRYLSALASNRDILSQNSNQNEDDGGSDSQGVHQAI